jgi:hypothetical protein
MHAETLLEHSAEARGPDADTEAMLAGLAKRDELLLVASR